MIIKKSIISIISVIILTFIISIYFTETPIVKAKETKYNVEYIKKYENIVMLGDSITDWYPFEDIYGDLPIIRSGVAGYTTTDILDRMDEMVYQYNPTKVFILIGTNDIKGKEDKTEETEKNIIKIIKLIKKNRSKAKIYYQSIYPINSSGINAESRTNEEIQEINNYVKEYCNKNNVTYIDMYDELTDEDGELAKKYSSDGLHPNDLGYAKITQYLLRYIYEVN